MNETLSIFNSIVKDFLIDEVNNPVAEFVASDELFERLDLDLNDDPISTSELKTVLRELVFKTPRTATNAFFNQLFGGRNEKAVLGDLLAVILNNSMYTYKAAGSQVGVEKVVLREICDMIGWGERSNGTFASGGSMTNFMGMIMARDAKNSSTRYQGVHEKMTVYTSTDSHYSIPKNASFSGLGRDAIRYVDVDDKGKMDISHLEKTIKEDIENGCTPIMVNATAGTTVLGSFDDIARISRVCDQYDIWLHVDGAYCG